MRIRLVAIAIIAVFGGIAMLLSRPDEPSAECAQTEDALHPLFRTMYEIHSTLPRDIAFAPRPGEPEPDYAAASAREMKAANDTRAASEGVGSPDLKALLDEIADALALLGRSRLTPATPGAPSKEYFSATTTIREALYDIKKACPEIMDDEVPAPPVRPS